MLLQILEDGHLTDAKGRRVDFRNTVIIMTSNVGAKSLLKDTSLGFRPVTATEDQEREAQYERMKEKVLEQLKTQFRPEFLNRVDSLVVFRSLDGRGDPRDRGPAAGPRARAAARAADRPESRQEAKDHIIKLGYDVDYGARPLRRVIQNMVEDPLAEALLLGRFKAGRHGRRRPLARRRPDHRTARGEDARRGRRSARGSRARRASAYVCQVLRARPSRAGRASATPAARGTRSSRPSSASPARAARAERGRGRPRSRVAHRCAAGGARRRPAAPRQRVGIGEVDRVLGRRARAGRAGAARWRAGHRQVDARARRLAASVAAIAGRGHGRDRPLRDRARSRPTSSTCAPPASACAGRAGDASSVLAATGVEAILERPRAHAPALLVVDSVQTRRRRRAGGPAGSVGQVREAAARLGALGARAGHPRPAGRPRHQGRQPGRPADARAPRRRGPHAGGRPIRRAAAAARAQEPPRLDRGGRRPGDDRRRACARWPTRRGRSWATTSARRRASRSRPSLEGSRPLLVEVQALVAPAGMGLPRRTVAGIDATALALLIAVLARRGGVDVGGRDVYVSLAGGARGRRARARPARWPSRSPRRSAIGPSRAGRSPVARSRCWASCGRCAGLERRLREAARLGFARAIVPAGGASSARVADARPEPVGDVPGASRSSGAHAPRRAGASVWAGGPVRLGEERSGRRSGSFGRHATVRPLPGAALGAHPGHRAGEPRWARRRFFEPRPGAACAARGLDRCSWAVVGYAILPHITVEPARWIMRAVTDMSTDEFVAAIVGLLLGLLMGFLLGLPLDEPALARRAGAADRRLDRAGAGDDGPDGRQARRPAQGARSSSASCRRGAASDDPDAPRRPVTYVDTSAIIDGRIVDVVASGFLSGTLVVPRFVLGELQHIADDSQPRRRSRGRRGLDVLSVLQKDHRVDLELSDEDEPGTSTVDAKLVGARAAPRRGHPHDRLQPQPGRAAPGRPGHEPQPARQRAQARVPARRGAAGQGHPGGQGARPGRRVPRRRHDGRRRGRQLAHPARARRDRHAHPPDRRGPDGLRRAGARLAPDLARARRLGPRAA